MNLGPAVQAGDDELVKGSVPLACAMLQGLSWMHDRLCQIYFRFDS